MYEENQKIEFPNVSIKNQLNKKTLKIKKALISEGFQARFTRNIIS